MFLFPETLPPERRRAFDWRAANPLGALLRLRHVPSILPLALVALWWDFASMVYPATWSFFTIARYGWTPGVIGASLALVGICMAATQMLLVGPIVKRLGEQRAGALGLVMATIGFVGYTVAPEGWMVWPILVISSLQSLVMPSLSGLMSRRMPADRQGELQGFNGSLIALASMLAPLVMNPVLAHFTRPGAAAHFPGAAFAIAAVSAVVALVLLLRLPHQRASEGSGAA